MPFSNTYANLILNYTFSKVAKLDAPEFVYIGFCSNDPEADNGTFNELSGNGYSRVLISQRGQTYPDVIGTASNRQIKNTKQINWTKATGKWTDAKGIGLFSTLTGGAPFYYCKLDNTLSVDANAVALFDAGELSISITSTDISNASVQSQK